MEQVFGHEGNTGGREITVEPLNFYTLQKKTFCPKNVNNEKKIENLKKL